MFLSEIETFLPLSTVYLIGLVMMGILDVQMAMFTTLEKCRHAFPVQVDPKLHTNLIINKSPQI